MQRRAVEAVLKHFAEPANNPVSEVYDGPMLDGADVWCWDARPYPAFPARADVWTDAGAWRAGHWLNGRLVGDTSDILAAILRRGGVDDEDYVIGATDRAVQGFVIDRPMRTRDALAPLLTALGMTSAERVGKIALIGSDSAAVAIDPQSLALPDEGAETVRVRTGAAAVGTARVRFIDDSADYQTGAVTVRSDAEGDAIDLDLPVVCGLGLATAVANDALNDGVADTLALSLGPVEAMRLEPGDVVSVDDVEGVWRIDRLEIAETTTATLSRHEVGAVGEDGMGRSVGETPRPVGAPFLTILDLPPLPGHEGDDRPIAVVAADPWRPMAVWSGGSFDALTLRGAALSPARVGVLEEPLVAGVIGRWDEVNTITLRVEGGAPASLSDAAVLGGANAVAIETTAGWEIVQFRHAALVGGSTWRLSGLLRAQQGTELEMEAGAAVGATVVFLGDDLTRVEMAADERGLPMVWRAGPRGGPAGGTAVAERGVVVTGVHHRPFRPAHLRVSEIAEGARIAWIARMRTSGDVWEGEPVASDPLRFRVRVFDGGDVVRQFEVEGSEAVYAAAEIAADFPGGVGPSARIGVAQSDGRMGWGGEATVAFAG
jgi:hypothetical protein